MASIHKHGNLQWEARVRRKGHPIQCKTFEAKADPKNGRVWWKRRWMVVHPFLKKKPSVPPCAKPLSVLSLNTLKETLPTPTKKLYAPKGLWNIPLPKRR